MKNKIKAELSYSGWQIFALTMLRVLIGWHFLYEGLIKAFSPSWSSESYLSASVGPFSSFFKTIAASEQLLHIVNVLNMWGLILIGLCLFVGVMSKFAKIMGVLLLSFYYMALPPLSYSEASLIADGSYWIVNMNLIEISALIVLLLFPSSHITGIDKFLTSFIKYIVPNDSQSQHNIDHTKSRDS